MGDLATTGDASEKIGTSSQSEDGTTASASESARQRVPGSATHWKARTQRGTKYTYEVVWAPCNGKAWPNTFEPASCLIGWEAEMNKIDEDIEKRANEAHVNVVQMANAARELAPATSASVERLFSEVGIVYSAKRKSSASATVANVVSGKLNLP